MSKVDREIILEGLSALTGATVKPYTGSEETWDPAELNVYNFITSTITGLEAQELAAAEYGTKDVLCFLGELFNNIAAVVSQPVSQPTAIGGFRAGLHKELFVDMDKFFDPKFDYDFTNLRDTSVCIRGDEPYKRPCGWYRIALKVLDKYPDGNAWLGTDGWRSYSVAGEWPVSYHGTSIEGAKQIVKTHYKAGPRNLYERGIYSTYDIDQASGYSKEFTSKKNGKTYRIIMQNRINPQMRKVCDRKDYWLIEVPADTSPAEEKEIVEKSIRPYGLLLKVV